MRAALFIAIAVVVFGSANFATARWLLRLHPRRRRIVQSLLVAGNLMWLLLPILNARTDFSRFVRATLGPVWFAWQSFAIVYATLMAIAFVIVRRHAAVVSRVFLWITIVASVVGYYDAIVPLRVEHVPVAIANLPPNLNGTRIAVMGDLHVGLFTRDSRLRQFFATAGA